MLLGPVDISMETSTCYLLLGHLRTSGKMKTYHCTKPCSEGWSLTYWAGLGVAEPLEAYPRKGLYVAWADLDREEVRQRLLWEIRSGAYFYIHFGIPCSSWSCLQERT